MGSTYVETATTALTAVHDADLRASVGTLFEDAQSMIDNGDVDLVVVTARRLACVYQLLVSAGMSALTGCAVVSDRFLDSNPSLQSTSKNVLLLDDSIVVGTTLARLHDELRRRIGGDRTIYCRSVCLDDQQYTAFLLEGLDVRAYHRVTSDEALRFSNEVVLSLFENLVPFFTDFPITHPCEFSPTDWIGWLEELSWHTADVTPPFEGLPQQEYQALSHIPRQADFEEFLSRIPPEVAELVDIVKLRSYSRRSESRVRVVFVPIALLTPCKPRELDRALTAISEQLQAIDASLNLNWLQLQHEAKQRHLQLYLCGLLLEHLRPRMPKSLAAEPLWDAIETLPISLYFGLPEDTLRSLSSAVARSYEQSKPGQYELPAQLRLERPPASTLLKNRDVQRELWAAKELLAGMGLPEEPHEGQLTKVGLIFSHAISSIFGFVNRELESEQRREIRSLSSRAEYDERYPDGDGRILNQGFTMRELVESLAPQSLTGNLWLRSVVSLALDAGNDMGIIVPTTKYDEGRDIVYRCYRIGETASLAETPITEVIEGKSIDSFVRNGLSTVPVRNRTGPIAELVEEVCDPQTPELVWLVALESAPGRVVSFFNGRVISLGTDTFEAELSSPLGEDQRMARMQYGQIESKRDELQPGSRFAWSVFQRTREDGAELRTSIIRLKPSRSIDIQKFDVTLEALRSLGGDAQTRP